MQLASFLWIFEGFMLPCLTKKYLGIDCPGCGLQRSVAFLLQGDFLAAFKMYPAIYALLPLLGFVLLNNFVRIRHNTKIIIFLAITSVALILG
ncbi:MAG TPA: DUF2752 domain-containing protein, partial [Pricia sp.]|nr:DUF2752 domain-containing protein [Pricia sp.]